MSSTCSNSFLEKKTQYYDIIFVDLRWNEIGPSGATTLLTMLQKNHCLTDVRLVGNGIPPFVQKQIGEMNPKNFGTRIL